MKVEVTLTSDEYAALATAPGKSAPQRLKFLVKFWEATKAEHEKRVTAESEPLKERNYREYVEGAPLELVRA